MWLWAFKLSDIGILLCMAQIKISFELLWQERETSIDFIKEMQNLQFQFLILMTNIIVCILENGW